MFNHSKESLLQAMTPFLDSIIGFDIDDWGSNSANIVFTENNEDFALFEYQHNKVYSGHIFCKNLKGKSAEQFAKKSLNFMFTFYAEVINGLVPIKNRHVTIMMRKLGFKSYGEVNTPAGLMTHLILTKKEWRELHG